MPKGLKSLIQWIWGFSFVRNAGVLGLAELWMAIMLFAQGIIVARWLGPEQYGIAALIMSYPALLFGFFDAKASTATTKFVGEFSIQGRRESALAMCRLGYLVDAGIALLTLVVVAATAGWAESHIVHTPGVAWLMTVYSLAYLFQAFASPSRAVLLLQGRFRSVAVAEGVSTTIGASAVIGLVLYGWGVKGVVFGNMVTWVLSGLVLGALAQQTIRRTWGGSWIRAPWRALQGRKREIIRFLAFTELTELFNLLGKQTDIVILGYFSGPTQAGYYRVAKRMAGVVSVMVKPLQSTLYPRLARQWGGAQFDDLRRTVSRYVFWMGLPLGGLVLLGIPLVPWATVILVGEAYIPSVPVAQLLFATAALWLMFSWLRPLFHALGEVKFLFMNMAFLNVASAIGYLLAAPRWGAVGVGWATLLASSICGFAVGLIYALYRLRRIAESRSKTILDEKA